jgi:hypothetical protein
MKRTILLLVLSAAMSAFAQQSSTPCVAQGVLHLVDPPTTVYCQHEGVTVWAATYNVGSKQLVVFNRPSDSFWYFPLKLGTIFRGSMSEDSQKAHFKLKVGFMEDEYWLNVGLFGSY